MSYNSISQMARSQSLRERITACAAAENVPDPASWAAVNGWALASSPGWAGAWDYATDNYTPNYNADTGIRTDVISDVMILSAVQTLLAETPA